MEVVYARPIDAYDMVRQSHTEHALAQYARALSPAAPPLLGPAVESPHRWLGQDQAAATAPAAVETTIVASHTFEVLQCSLIFHETITSGPYSLNEGSRRHHFVLE